MLKWCIEKWGFAETAIGKTADLIKSFILEQWDAPRTPGSFIHWLQWGWGGGEVASNMHTTKYFPLVWDAEPTDIFFFYPEYMQLLQ